MCKTQEGKNNHKWSHLNPSRKREKTTTQSFYLLLKPAIFKNNLYDIYK